MIRNRAIKALLISITIIVAMWVGLPILYRDWQGNGNEASRLYKIDSGRVLVLQREVGMNSAFTFDESLIAWRSDAELVDAIKMVFQMDVHLSNRPEVLPEWAIPPGGFKNGEAGVVLAIGLPIPMARMISLERGWWADPDPVIDTDSEFPESRELGLYTIRGVDFPVSPIWSGITMNLTFWWLIAFGVLSIPLRPWLRRRKGRCPKCAYDLKRDFDSGCPECGWGRDVALNEPRP